MHALFLMHFFAICCHSNTQSAIKTEAIESKCVTLILCEVESKLAAYFKGLCDVKLCLYMSEAKSNIRTHNTCDIVTIFFEISA